MPRQRNCSSLFRSLIHALCPATKICRRHTHAFSHIKRMRLSPSTVRHKVIAKEGAKKSFQRAGTAHIAAHETRMPAGRNTILSLKSMTSISFLHCEHLKSLHAVADACPLSDQAFSNRALKSIQMLPATSSIRRLRSEKTAPSVAWRAEPP